jgi:hypothetical protein
LIMNQILTIARKEIADGLRDSRSVVASLAYALMGPVVVGLVSMTVHGKTGSEAVLTGMMAIFTLVSGFVGGMNVAMDTVAGERERKSLLPLLMNAVPRTSVVLGKWLAVSFFAIGGLAINVLGFARNREFHRIVIRCIRIVHSSISGGGDPVVHFYDFARRERSADVSIFSHVCADGDGNVSGVLSDGETGVVQFSAGRRTTTATRSADESGESWFLRAGHVGIFDLGGIRRPAAPSSAPVEAGRDHLR